MKYVVANDPNYNISTFGLEAVQEMDALNPNDVATFNGDFTPFFSKGGKLISFHGRADPVNSLSSLSLASFTNNLSLS